MILQKNCPCWQCGGTINDNTARRHWSLYVSLLNCGTISLIFRDFLSIQILLYLCNFGETGSWNNIYSFWIPPYISPVQLFHSILLKNVKKKKIWFTNWPFPSQWSIADAKKLYFSSLFNFLRLACKYQIFVPSKKHFKKT